MDKDKMCTSYNLANFLGNYEIWFESSDSVTVAGKAIVKEDFSTITLTLNIGLNKGANDSMEYLLNRIQRAILLPL